MNTTQEVGIERIDGGWCIKISPDGTFCIDVVKMMFNYRILKSRIGSDGSKHTLCDAGYCYFGHGVDDSGAPRTMNTAYHAAIAAAIAWNGEGHPPGYDKQAF
ncbi:hypothetical protein GS896_25205 [Rhodococcus hoagii]|nr:hypothetical protein [Prescottella equi]MBM4654197.1 hypothetical protein [Prescottella equi]MBM4719671.1 hypothetical protein [Prescottella equi]NKR23468.1 hypothetical protein [Prescottella equi]NKT55920.1 hypothetical protein [Prescottella equi]